MPRRPLLESAGKPTVLGEGMVFAYAILRRGRSLPVIGEAERASQSPLCPLGGSYGSAAPWPLHRSGTAASVSHHWPGRRCFVSWSSGAGLTPASPDGGLLPRDPLHPRQSP